MAVGSFMRTLSQKRLPKLSIELSSYAGSALDQIVVSGGNFALTIILAHQLGIVKFGVWAAIWMCVYLAGAIHNALIITPLQMFTDEKARLEDRDYLGAMMILQFGLLLAISVCAVLLIAMAEMLSLFSLDASAIIATVCLI
ncbi:MAG: hypothetical protein ACR2O4_02445, partial [Hyphomicrobiaceae bacterium]